MNYTHYDGTKVTILVDRQLQNKEGEKIVHFKEFFDQLIIRTGYVKAKEIMRNQYNIFVCVK